MDNRSHEEAQWEPEVLRLEMLELKALDLDLNLTGFNSRELDASDAAPGAGQRRQTRPSSAGGGSDATWPATCGRWESIGCYVRTLPMRTR